MSAGDIVFKTGEIPRIVGPTSDVYFVLIDDDNAEQIELDGVPTKHLNIEMLVRMSSLSKETREIVKQELDANLRAKNKDIIDI